MIQPPILAVDLDRAGTLGRTLLAFGTLVVTVVCALAVPSTARANTNFVEIINVGSKYATGNSTRKGLRADVMWASTEDGQQVFLWPDNTSASQLFDLIYVASSRSGNRYFQLRARHSGKCLMLDRTQTTVGNGTRIAQYPCPSPSYTAAQWSFEPMNPHCDDTALCKDTGWKIIRNNFFVRSRKCLDTDNASGRHPGQQATLQVWTCIKTTRDWNADNQIWRVQDAATRKTVYQIN